MQLKNIRLLLSLCPVHISHPYRPKPRHWKSNQKIPKQPQTFGERIKKHRLELGWFQRDVAAKIGISSTSISDWERGVTFPARRMKKKIQEFLEHEPKPIPKKQLLNLCATCGISQISSARCLFEKVCNQFRHHVTRYLQ